MITSPAEYRFVDFDAGTMPTSRIDGNIMPLRSGRNFGMIKGEDIAFIYEAACERLRLFDGASVDSGYVYHAPNTPHLVPDRRILASQMNSVIARVNAINRPSDFVFLSELAPRNLAQDLQAAAERVYSDEEFGIDAAFDKFVKPKLSTTDIHADVRVGDPLRISTISSLFHAIKDCFSRPLLVAGPEFADISDLVLVDSSPGFSYGRARSTNFVVLTVDDRNGKYEVYAPSSITIARIPSLTLDVRRVWAALWIPDFERETPYVGAHINALIDVSQFVTVTKSTSEIVLTVSASQSFGIMKALFAASGIVYPFDFSRFSSRTGLKIGYWGVAEYIIETDDSFRTKWW